MLYASAAGGIQEMAKQILADSSLSFTQRKIETSDPKEINEAYLISELGLKTADSSNAGSTGAAASGASSIGARIAGTPIDQPRAFARPARPGRR